MKSNKTILDRSHLLTLENKTYKKVVKDYFAWILHQDLFRKGDLTVNCFQEVFEKKAKAQIKNKSKGGIFAGKEEIAFLFDSHNIEYQFFCQDGDSFSQSNSVLVELQGKASDILKVERLSLNLLQRMVSIATVTNTFVSILESSDSRSKITATRKNILGLIDKKAVSVGGGLTHRLGLFDGVLFKDNHLKMIKEKGISSKNIVGVKTNLVEVEVEKVSEALVFADNLRNFGKDVVIMLDNFSVNMAHDAIKKIEEIQLKKGNRNKIFTEISGGVDLDNLEIYGTAGADFISSSKLGLYSSIVDLSLDFV